MAGGVSRLPCPQLFPGDQQELALPYLDQEQTFGCRLLYLTFALQLELM